MYLGRIKVIPAPTSVCLAMLMVIVGLIVIRDYLYRNQGSVILYMFRENAAVIAPFLLIVFFSLLLSIHPGAYWKEGGKWIYLILYGFVIFFFAMLLPSFPLVRRHYSTFVRISLYIVCISIFIDLFAPGTFSNVVARAAGFPENSNFSALATTMVCTAALGYHERDGRTRDWITIFIASLGVFATLSRSGMLEFFVLLLFYGYFTLFSGGVKLRNILVLVGGATAFVAIMSVTIPILIEHTEMFSKYKTRVTSFTGSEQVDDGSSEHRRRAILESLELISSSPIVGNGTAHTRTMRELPHNIYLMQWVNNGLGGLCSYLALLASAFWVFYKRGYRPGQAFIAVSLLGGLFSHNVLDQRPFLILLGSLLGMSLYASGKLSVSESTDSEVVRSWQG
jgi:O-antigen ligase